MSEIDGILRDIERQMRDLHLLYINDVASVDLLFYNEVTVARIEAKARIEKAKEHFEARMQEAAGNYQQQPEELDLAIDEDKSFQQELQNSD